jgi:hypothetical protein
LSFTDSLSIGRDVSVMSNRLFLILPSRESAGSGYGVCRPGVTSGATLIVCGRKMSFCRATPYWYVAVRRVVEVKLYAPVAWIWLKSLSGGSDMRPHPVGKPTPAAPSQPVMAAYGFCQVNESFSLPYFEYQ